MSTLVRSSACWGLTALDAPRLLKPLRERFRRRARLSSRTVISPDCPSYRIARLGLGYVPENRDIFPSLTVRQNLMLGIKDPRRPGKWRLDDTLRMFPNLAERADTAAGVLSSGEQQMLTICRTLMGDPELVIIDEPTEGLAPFIATSGGIGLSARSLSKTPSWALDFRGNCRLLFLLGHPQSASLSVRRAATARFPVNAQCSFLHPEEV